MTYWRHLPVLGLTLVGYLNGDRAVAKTDRVAIEQREACRKELKGQVDDFLANGGVIQKIINSKGEDKPGQKIYRPSYAQSIYFS